MMNLIYINKVSKSKQSKKKYTPKLALASKVANYVCLPAGLASSGLRMQGLKPSINQ